MSSETGKRFGDRMNMLGVVVVGICGAVLVYVSIALLQAFYLNDTAQVETMADYGGQDTTARSLKAEQVGHIDPAQGVRNPTGTFGIKIDRAIDLVVDDAKRDATMLVPSQGKSVKPTIQPVYGRPKLLNQPPAAGAGAGTGSAAPVPPAGAGSGSAAAPPAPAAPAPATQEPAGAGTGSAAAPAKPAAPKPPARPTPRPRAPGTGTGTGTGTGSAAPPRRPAGGNAP